MSSANVWHDVGISLKDTGDGGAKAIIVVCDSGNDQTYGAVKDQPWKPKFQQIENLSLAAGAFTNEAKHATYIKIGVGPKRTSERLCLPFAAMV